MLKLDFYKKENRPYTQKIIQSNVLQPKLLSKMNGTQIQTVRICARSNPAASRGEPPA